MYIRHSLIAMVACIAGAAIAQESPVIQGSVGINNVRYQVSDIRPEDGIAASLAIKSPQNTSGTVTGQIISTSTTRGEYDASVVSTGSHLLDTRTYEVALPNNEAVFVKQPDGILATLAVLPSTFGKSSYETQPDGWWSEPSIVGGGFFNSRFDDGKGIALTLGAGTELRISGELFSELHLNTDAVVGLTKGQDLLVTAGNSAYVYLAREWDSGVDLSDVLVGNSGASLGQSVERTVTPFGSGPDDAANAFERQSFELVARNTRDTSVTLYLYTSMYVGGTWGSANLAPVPEPSTWALVFAGLALMGVFARRRQAA